MPISTRQVRRAALPVLLLAALGTAAGCGDDDNGSASTKGSTVSASSAPTGGALSAGDARSLGDAQQQIAQACRDKSTSPEGAVALISSLYEIDPAAKTPNGKTVKAVAAQASTQLAGCGQKQAAKELADLK